MWDREEPDPVLARGRIGPRGCSTWAAGPGRTLCAWRVRGEGSGSRFAEVLAEVLAEVGYQSPVPGRIVR